MKIVFMGTPDFGVPALEAISKRHEIAACVCQPDKVRRARQDGILRSKKVRFGAQSAVVSIRKGFPRRRGNTQKSVSGHYGNGGLRADFIAGSDRYSPARNN